MPSKKKPSKKPKAAPKAVPLKPGNKKPKKKSGGTKRATLTLTKQCAYVECGAKFVGQRSTAKFCTPKHRVAQFRVNN